MGDFAAELDRVEREIAELAAKDVAMQKERTLLSRRMQAAMHRKALLANAQDERVRHAGVRQKRPTRRRPPPVPPTQRRPRPTAPTPPPQEPFSDAVPLAPEGGDRPPAVRPEASSRSVQNTLLGLGALVLGVAATVFAGLAISTLDDLTRTAILIAATVLTLCAPPIVARRGLTATAETIAAVGLLLVPLDGYALWTVDRIHFGVPGWTYAGVVFAITAGVAFLYARGTGLGVPRYATLFALQPVVPLLAYEWIDSFSGWALTLTAVAALDLLLARWLPGPLATWAGAPAGVTTRRPAAPESGRPEGLPEEPDAVVTVSGEVVSPRPRARPAVEGADEPPGVEEVVIDARSTPVRGPQTPADGPAAVPAFDAPPSVTFWLRDVAWILHGIAVVAALAFATAALAMADRVGPAAVAGGTLLLAALLGLIGALSAGRQPLPDIAAGVVTLAFIAAVGRVAAVALPGRAMLAISAVVALTAIVVRALPGSGTVSGPPPGGGHPEPERPNRGPQIASALALAVIGVVVAAAALRAAVAPIRAATPAWEADLSRYGPTLAEAVHPVGWQLVVSTLLLTIAAALALPFSVRREAAVAGATLTTVAAPASLGLPWYLTPWLLAAGAVAIGASGLTAAHPRAARAHVIGAGVAGLFAAAAAAIRPGLTGAVLAALAVAGVLIAITGHVGGRLLAPDRTASAEVAASAVGGSALALPGAATATAVGAGASTAAVLAAGFLAVCVSLVYAALVQVSRREIGMPLTIGAGLGALAVTAASFGASGATPADAWVGALIMVAAILLFLAPTIDSGLRADRQIDGPDVAAAAVTGAVLASLTRVASLVVPGTELVAGAALVLAVAAAARALPEGWRRGPVLGVTLAGAVIALIAGYETLRGGLRALAAPGPIWDADLSAWSAAPDPNGWQAPVALLLLAVAAAILLPRPASYDAAAVCVGLATIGVPVALGLPWWSPVLVDGVVAAVYATAAVVARDPRAGRTRATVAAAVALHGVGAGLVRPWTTAAALLLIALLGAAVAVFARVAPSLLEPPRAPDDTLVDLTRPRLPAHLVQIGGAGLAGALLASPGAVASIAAGSGRAADVVLGGALGATSIGLAAVAATRRKIAEYLPYATLGVAGGATVTAAASVPTGQPTGVYAAAAALLGVIAELLRANTPNPSAPVRPVRRSSPSVSGPLLRQRAEVFATPTRWSLSPPMGALAVAALPAALAIASIAPVLTAALVDPFATLDGIWQGPPPVLVDPLVADETDGTSVVAALLLTIAAALAAVGFGGGRTAQAFPVVLPGMAATLLIAPIALEIAWPASTMAALAVFTLCMLGVALTPPPPATERARPLRITRNIAFAIGLAAGGAGLAGSLATRPLTLFTLGGAVAVGLTAGLGGRTQAARILGWLFGSVFAQLFVLTAGLVAGADVRWSAFGVLGVGAVLLILAGLVPRLRRPEAVREAAAVEWSGYASALLALALTYDSLRHVAALLAAWGAVLGVSAIRRGRRPSERRILFWAAVLCEIVAWWILMSVADVALPEAYTLPFAALALLIGVLELRHRPDLGSWAAYGPALVAAFLPTLIIVLTTEASAMRQVLLLLGGVATLIAGSVRRQRAPVVVGAVVTAIAALHALTLVGPWLVLIPVGIVLLVVGANNEKRRRDLQRLRGALQQMR